MPFLDMARFSLATRSLPHRRLDKRCRNGGTGGGGNAVRVVSV